MQNTTNHLPVIPASASQLYNSVDAQASTHLHYTVVCLVAWGSLLICNKEMLGLLGRKLDSTWSGWKKPPETMANSKLQFIMASWIRITYAVALWCLLLLKVFDCLRPVATKRPWLKTRCKGLSPFRWGMKLWKSYYRNDSENYDWRTLPVFPGCLPGD